MKRNARDKFLIHRVSKGNPEAFGKIYQIYIDKIYRFVYFKVSSKEIAEDLSGQVFYKLLDKLSAGEAEISNLQAFLYSMARNIVIDHYRASNLESGLDIEEDLSDEVFSAGSEQEIIKQLDVKADLDKVRQILQNFNQTYRDVIIWYYLEGFQAQEIAEFIDKTPGATRVLIHRALNKLKKELT